MDEQVAQLQVQRQGFNQEPDIKWIPVRHHSPACAFYLQEMLRKYEPDVLLVEGAVDYQSKLAAIASVNTRPPVAIYSSHSFFPLGHTSPEYQAIIWASQNHKTLRFIDLPLSRKEEYRKASRDPQLFSEHNEALLQHSEYVMRLSDKYGCRNTDELWERLFEVKQFATPEQFFQQLFDYCAVSRLAYSADALEQSGDLARERHMRACIKQWVHSGHCCFVITGGFHTPALFDYADENTSVKMASEAAQDNWLIRYSEDRLDALNGYSAGIPAPGFYEKLFRYRCEQKQKPLQLQQLVFAWIDDLITEQDGLPVNTANKMALCEQVLGLAQLRGHAFPGLFDVKDALQSVLVKRECTFQDPLLAKIHQLLAGNRLGDIDSNQASVPLVSSFAALLKKSRFKLDKTSASNASFQLYKLNENARNRLRLLNQCQFVGIDFCSKLNGPDWERGYDLDRQTEEWRYAWTPWVEANLIDLSHLAADWDMLLSKKIQMATESIDDSLLAAQQLFVRLVLMGALPLAPDYWHKLNKAVNQCNSPDELAELILLLLRLRSFESNLVSDFHAQFKVLAHKAWEQLMFSLPAIGKLESSQAFHVLVQTQAITRELEDTLQQAWRNQWIERLLWLIEYGQLQPGLLFACRALLVGTDGTGKDKVIEDLERLFRRQFEDAFQAFQGVVTVAPEWLLGTDKKLLMLLNQLLSSWDEGKFTQALPDLRFLFSHVSPAQIEKVSQRVCELNHWSDTIEVFNPRLQTEEVLEAQSAYQKLVEQLTAEGLGHWIEH